MNVKAMQRADRWLGVPLCFALTIIRALFGRSTPDTSLPLRSLLFVKLPEQGSTVLAYWALRDAIEMVGRENVYFIAFQDNRFILDALDIIPEQNVITISVENFPAFVQSTLLAIWRIRRLKLDAAIDMDFLSRASAALTYMSGARRRAGFHAFYGDGPYRGDLMTHRLLYNPHRHTSEAFLSLVEALRRPPATLPTFDFVPAGVPEPPRFSPAPEEVTQVREIVLAAGASPPLILLNPNAGDLLPLRRWPAARYVELAQRVLAKYPEVSVGFTGAPGEAAATGELVRQVGSNRCVSFAGRTTLRQLLVLFTLADMLVTNDSGPAHFATLTPIHAVTLFGPETPALFAARTPRNTALWAGIICSPCVNAYNNRQSPCRNNVCMQAITVEQVFAEVCRAYDARRTAAKAS